jgi:hypothetical protein
MNRFILTITGVFFLAATLSVPAVAETTMPTQQGPAEPGTINYVEGQVAIGNEALSPSSAGSAILGPDQTLNTQNGKAEILLTPGVFLRVGDDSAVQMISPDLTKTEVNVNDGEAMVEVDQIFPQNDLLIGLDGAQIQLEKTGLYDFNANQSEFRVISGHAVVHEDDHAVGVNGGHELSLNAPKLKTQKLNKKEFETADNLYRWSSLRSAYLAEANVNQAPVYLTGGWPWAYGGYGPGWLGADWYWDPSFDCYTFIPGDGIFYSPFGWGFYPPYLAYEAPIYYGHGGHFPHHFGPRPGQWGPGPHYNPRIAGGGFHNGFHPTTGIHRETGTHAFLGQPRRFGVNNPGFRGAPRVGTFPGARNFHSPPAGGFHGPAGGDFHGGGFGGGGFHGGFGGRR